MKFVSFEHQFGKRQFQGTNLHLTPDRSLTKRRIYKCRQNKLCLYAKVLFYTIHLTHVTNILLSCSNILNWEECRSHPQYSLTVILKPGPALLTETCEHMSLASEGKQSESCVNGRSGAGSDHVMMVNTCVSWVTASLWHAERKRGTQRRREEEGGSAATWWVWTGTFQMTPPWPLINLMKMTPYPTHTHSVC